MKVKLLNIDYPYWIVTLIGLVAIAYFENVETALLVALILVSIASGLDFLTNMYLLFINKIDRKFFRPLIISTIIVLVTSYILFTFYGSYAFLRPLSISLVVFFVILIYNRFLRSKH